MALIPPPQGMSEVDYETIEAAVTETVRGRWFLAEFARRNRLAETRQLLDAMARLEATVATGAVALPSADPSIRLLIQRIKDIAGQLSTVAGDMRVAGVEERFVEAVDGQARAVSGMMRSATTQSSTPLPAQTAKAPEPTQTNPATQAPPRMPRAQLPPQFEPRLPEQQPSTTGPQDARLGVLAEFDSMPLP